MKVYKSKISYRLLLFIFLILVLSFGFGIFKAESIQSIIIPIGVFILIFGFVLHLFLNTKYAIINSVLKIKSGFLYYKELDIHSIKSISNSNSLMSSPAASLDRIELSYGKYTSVIISPKDKSNFIKDLVKINLNILVKQ
ncbi:PH domain-containing protein [Thalassobellus sediminis]|uniref:PH domain-containing protein n=1 Tax=Thalassobellus sediminis TaxID=3367753 RepID=UPI00379DC54D